MPRIPRDLSGDDLCRLLKRIGYRVIRQHGSHIRLEAIHPKRTHRLTVPGHDAIKIGTLSNILVDVAEAMGVAKSDLINRLFGK